MTLALAACDVAHVVANRKRVCTQQSATIATMNLSPVLPKRTYAVAWPTFTYSLFHRAMENPLGPAVQAIIGQPDEAVDDVTGFSDVDEFWGE